MPTITLTVEDLRPDTIRAALTALLPPVEVVAPVEPVEPSPPTPVLRRAPLRAARESDQPKLESFRAKYGEEGVEIVRDYVAQDAGGEVDIERIKRHLGMCSPDRTVVHRSNLLPAVLRACGCAEPKHATWLAPEEDKAATGAAVRAAKVELVARSLLS